MDDEVLTQTESVVRTYHEKLNSRELQLTHELRAQAKQLLMQHGRRVEWSDRFRSAAQHLIEASPSLLEVPCELKYDINYAPRVAVIGTVTDAESNVRNMEIW